jgi:fatty acid desaturase
MIGLAGRQDILDAMRTFSLLFAFIALVMLAMFLIYVFSGPAEPLIAGGIFVSFVACLVPALLLLKPFEPPEELRRRREEARREREERRRSNDESRRGSGS